MKIRFLSGFRGIAFQHGFDTRNVHFRDMFGLTGHNWQTRLFWVRYSWAKLLTLGKYH